MTQLCCVPSIQFPSQFHGLFPCVVLMSLAPFFRNKRQRESHPQLGLGRSIARGNNLRLFIIICLCDKLMVSFVGNTIRNFNTANFDTHTHDSVAKGTKTCVTNMSCATNSFNCD